MTEPEQRPTEQPEKQSAEALHSQALASEALPVIEKIYENLLELDQRAQDGEPDLAQMRAQFQRACTKLSHLKKQAEYLDSTRR